MKMQRKFLIIVNPYAGAFDSGHLWDAVTNFYRQKGIQYDVFYTSNTIDYGIKLRKEWLNDFSDVLVIGGDGTISAAVHAFVHQPIPISILPAGTGNDFVKNLGIPKKIDEALNISLNGKVILSDCGLCDQRHFINGVGIGFDGKVVEHLLNHFPAKKGNLAYFSTVMKILALFKESQLTYSYDHVNVSEDIFLMTIANGTTFGGGFKLTPNAKIDDGLLDVCLIKKIHPLKRLLKMPLLKSGSHGKIKEVDFFTVEKIDIGESDLLVAHLDGDYIGKPPFNIRVVEKAIKFRSGMLGE